MKHSCNSWLFKTVFLFLSLSIMSFTIFLSGGKENSRKTQNLPEVRHHAFLPGEQLVYKLHYGIINAGIAKLEIEKKELKINGREILHIVGTGTSIGAFDWFFKVRDRYETYLDKRGVFPWAFVRRVDEGGYTIKQDYTFYQKSHRVDNGAGKRFDVPEAVQDMISSFYYARTMDFSYAKKGDIFTVNAFVDDEVYPIKIKFMGRDDIRIATGKYRCMRFVPVVQQGRIFEKEDDLQVWISDDGNKIPLLAKANVLVGSIKMELIACDGLANPPAFID